MFVISENQISAFALPFAKKKRDKIIAELKIKEVGKVYEDGKHVIVEKKRGNKIIIQFSEEHKLQKVIKPSGIEYGFEYDEEGRLIKFLLPGDEKIEWAYEGRLLKGLAFNEVTMGIEYNEKNKITAIVYPDSYKIAFHYNEVGQLNEIINRAGRTKRFEIATRGGKVVYKNTDELRRVTEFESDGTGNIIKVIYPDRTIQQTAWDRGLQAERTILRSGIERVDFYSEKYAKKVVYKDGSFINISCNDTGRIDALENEEGGIAYQFDKDGRKVSESFQEKLSICHYNEEGILTEIVYPSKLKVNYLYDEDDRLLRIEIGNNKCEFRYEANDTLSAIVYPNKLIEYRKSKLIGGLTEIVIKTVWEETLCRQSFGYDKLFRLIKYSNRDSASVYSDYSLMYDIQNNFVGSIDMQSGSTTVYRYDAKGNLTEDNGVKVKVGNLDQTEAVGGNSIEYDSAGNIISFYSGSGNRIEMKYNDAGLMINSLVEGIKWEYKYDALRRRVSKSSYRESFIYRWHDDKLIVEEHQTNSCNVLREYIYTPYNALPVGCIENNHLYWFHKDVRGAVCNVSDENGSIVWSANYDAFGSTIITLNNFRQPWRLIGQYNDEETGLYYNYNRYYCPHLKSYTSFNPEGCQLQASNYSYTSECPFNQANHTGNSSFFINVGAAMMNVFIHSCLAGFTNPALYSLAKKTNDKPKLRWPGIHFKPDNRAELETAFYSNGGLAMPIQGDIATIIYLLTNNSLHDG